MLHTFRRSQDVSVAAITVRGSAFCGDQTDAAQLETSCHRELSEAVPAVLNPLGPKSEVR